MNVLELYHHRPRGSAAIAEVVESAVREGSISSDDLLPPVRTLAEAIQVSPATVAAAYRRLRLRGVVVTDGRRGTRVSVTPPLAHPYAPPVPPGVRDLASGNPDPALLPDISAALREVPTEPILYGHDSHDERLLQLGREGFDADGINSDATAVVGGALDGIERVLRVHLAPGDRVGLEDPGWRSVFHLVASLNLNPVPIAVDDDGIVPDAFHRSAQSGLNALIVTPRAQNPTGAALGIKRAVELRRMVSCHPDLLVIEDDHAGPVSGGVYESLVGKEREKWAVVRSVSKSFGPDLRVALMAGDAATIARVEVRQLLGPGWVSHILQRAVAQIWSDPAASSLVDRAAKIYEARRKAVIDALARRSIQARGKTGLNVWIEVREEPAVVAALLARNWAVAAGQEFRMMSAPAIRVTIATLPSHEAEAFAHDLQSVTALRARMPVA